MGERLVDKLMLVRVKGFLVTLAKDARMLSMLCFALFDVSLIGSFLASFFKSEGLSFIEVGAVLSVKNIARLVSDVPFGILADVVGLKNILLISRLLRISSLVAMLVSSNKWMACFSMALYGLSMSSIYGKIDGYIYSLLSGKNKKLDFPSVISSYYLVVNLVVVCAGLTSTYLFSFVGYNGLVILTICASLLSLGFWIFMPDSPSAGPAYKRKAALFVSGGRRYLWKRIVMMAILSLLTWGCNTVFSVSLLSAGVKPERVSLLTTIHFFCVGAGYFVAGLFHPRLEPAGYNRIVIISFALFSAMLPSFNVITLLLFYLFTITIPLLKGAHEVLFYGSIESEIRNSVFSISTLLASCFAVYLNLSYPFFIKFYSFGWAMFLSFSPLLLLTVLCSKD